MKESPERKPKPMLSFVDEVRLWSVVLGLTLLLPTAWDAYPGLGEYPSSWFFWEQLGVLGFAPFLVNVFPGIMGMVCLLLAQFNPDRGLLVVVVCIMLLLGIFVLGIDPTMPLGQFKLWVVFPGHRLMLFMGCAACVVATELMLADYRAVSWGTAGTALIVAYLLTPTLEGQVPIIDSIGTVWAGGDESQWPFAHFRLITELGLMLGASLTLALVGQSVRVRSHHRRKIVLAGWMMRGLIPAALFPLLVDYYQGMNDEMVGLVMARYYLIFISFFAVFPIAIARLHEGVVLWSLDEGSSGG